MRPRSFSAKLRLALLLPAIAALTVTTLLLGQLLVRLLQQSAADSLVESQSLLRPLISAYLDDSPEELQRRVASLADEDGLRVTLIREDGTVVADSARTWEQVLAMDNHGDRPEVRQAAAGGVGRSVRLSSTLGAHFVFTATRVRSPRGRELLLRLAQPVTDLRELRGTLSVYLALATAAAVLLSALTSWGLHRRLLRPISDLIADADRVMSGDPGPRVMVPEDPDLAPLARSFNRLAEQVESQVADLEAERQHQLAIVASMSEGVRVTDPEGRTVLANPAWRELFGIPAAPGAPEAMQSILQAKLENLIAETQRGGDSHEEEIEILTPTPRTAILTTSALAGGQGVVTVARDVTAFLRLSQIRRDFVANVSHELKTPLSAIRALAETLRDGALDDPEAAPRFTARILVQCRRLEALLSDLLTLSRLEHVAAGGELGRVDLRRTLEQAADGIAEMAREKGVAISIDMQPVPSIFGDPEALERLCLNLLHNAVKYNRRGGRVDVRLSSDEREIALEVADTGIGIPPESLDRIFERFYRVDKGRSRQEGGTGLGLAIVKHAAQLHGGRVEVGSRLGQGTTFRVMLPRHPASAESRADRFARRPVAPL